VHAGHGNCNLRQEPTACARSPPAQVSRPTLAGRVPSTLVKRPPGESSAPVRYHCLGVRQRPRRGSGPVEPLLAFGTGELWPMAMATSISGGSDAHVPATSRDPVLERDGLSRARVRVECGQRQPRRLGASPPPAGRALLCPPRGGVAPGWVADPLHDLAGSFPLRSSSSRQCLRKQRARRSRLPCVRLARSCQDGCVPIADLLSGVSMSRAVSLTSDGRFQGLRAVGGSCSPPAQNAAGREPGPGVVHQTIRVEAAACVPVGRAPCAPRLREVNRSRPPWERTFHGAGIDRDRHRRAWDAPLGHRISCKASPEWLQKVSPYLGRPCIAATNVERM
jgi:hypothetical protein